MNIQEYKKTMWVMVIGNTTTNQQNMKNELIGKILEVRSLSYNEEKLWVYNEKRNDYFEFNICDTQQVFPECVKDGYVIGLGDEIESKSDRWIVYDSYMFEDVPHLLCHRKNDIETQLDIRIDFRDLTVIPLHPKKEEEAKMIERWTTTENFMNLLPDEQIAMIWSDLGKVIDAVNSLLSAKPKGNE